MAVEAVVEEDMAAAVASVEQCWVVSGSDHHRRSKSVCPEIWTSMGTILRSRVPF